MAADRVVLAGDRQRSAQEATLGFARRRGQRRPRHEGGQRHAPAARGRRSRRSRPAATSLLFCNSTADEQVAALEAVIRAAESGALSPDAARRCVRAPAAGEGAHSRRAAPGRARVARRRRLRRAPGHRRRDGGVAMTPRTHGRASSSSGRCGPGSRVALVAPASPFDRARVRRGRRRTATARFRAGLRRRASSIATGSSPGRAERAGASLRRARGRAQDVDAIIAVRGGYGSVEVLPLLDADAIRGRAHGVRRLQRPDVAAHVPERPRGHDVGPRPDDRRPAGARARRRTTARRCCGSLSDRAAGRAGARTASRSSGRAKPPGRSSAAR